MVMQVAFYKGRKRPFNRVVSWWLRGPYSHCELVLGTSPLFGNPICASSSFMDGGVRVMCVPLDPANWDVVEVDGDEAAAWAWLAEHKGEGYDFLGLAGFVARVLGHSKHRWTCGEAVAAMLGIPDGWRFDPCGLYAALSRRQPRPAQQPASAGFFTPERNADA